MSNIYISEVSRYYREKGPGGFTGPATYFGSYQHFVSALRNSNVNNLEEQYIIGTDTCTETYVDTLGNTIVNKEFYDAEGQSPNNNYYRLETVILNPNTGVSNAEYYFTDDSLIVPTGVFSFIEDENNEDIFHYIEEVNDNALIFSDENVIVIPKTFSLIKEEKLFFVRERQSDSKIHVLTKRTGKRLAQDNRVITQEKIINHLI